MHRTLKDGLSRLQLSRFHQEVENSTELELQRFRAQQTHRVLLKHIGRAIIVPLRMLVVYVLPRQATKKQTLNGELKFVDLLVGNCACAESKANNLINRNWNFPNWLSAPLEALMKKYIVLLLILALPSIGFAQPERSKGISMHMLPQQVAKIDGRPWGFWVTYADYLQPEAQQPVLQSFDEFVAYVKKQTDAVQANGVWILTTHPEAYSQQEIELLETIKKTSKDKGIILFVCRGSKLPDGWERY